jgi:hypothetical protein
MRSHLIFTPFFSTKGSCGTGLGLAQVEIDHAAIDLLGASLEYDDGRKLDDLLEEAKTAIRNLDQSINELGKAS